MDGAADHHTGCPDAKDEVEQHAGEQRKAEGIDRTGGGGSEPEEDRVEHLSPEAVGGTESTHQDSSDDDDGDVAVDDGGQAHLEAALDCGGQGLVFGKCFLDALGGDDVGVNAHADAQDDTGNAGQGQRRSREHSEVAGNDSQRSGHLTKQRNGGDGAGQAVAHDHHDSDKGKGDDTGQDHDLQALGAQGRADGGVALRRQGERQRAGVDLVCQRGSAVLIEVALDDGLAAGDGLIDGGGGDVFIVQPDGDRAVVGGQLGGGIGKSSRAGGVELQLDDPALRLVIRGIGGSHVVTAENLLARGRGALAENHLGGGADLIDSRLRVEISLAGLPGKTDDDTILVTVNIALVVRNAQADQTVLDNGFCRRHLFGGGIHITGGHKGNIDTAADIDTEADIRSSLDVNVLSVAVLIACAEDRSQGKHHDQNCHDKQRP